MRYVLTFLVLVVVGCTGGTGSQSQAERSASDGGAASSVRTFELPVLYYSQVGCEGPPAGAHYFGHPECTAEGTPQLEMTVRSLSGVDGYCLELVPVSIVVCPVAL